MNESFLSQATEKTVEITKEAAEQMANIFGLNDLINYIVNPENVVRGVISFIAIIVFWIIYRLIRKLARKTASKAFEKKTVDIIEKAIKYGFFIIVSVYVLGLFGIKFSAIWGAAGIAGVAIGFAAQTSVSNLISGIFVITDKAMKHGDFIEVDGISGTVESVGAISVKVKTLDNQIIRVPNSTIINSKLINYSTMPYRRYVFDLSIDYSSDLDKAVEALNKVPSMCTSVITDKADYAPVVTFTTLGASGINMNLIVWCKKADFLVTKNEVCYNTVLSLREAGVNIPFNRLDVSMVNA